MSLQAAVQDKPSIVQLPSIFLPIVLFIVFDIVALGLNFWISARLETSAVAINLSGRQRMLSQRMTKSMLMSHIAKEPTQRLSSFDELAKSMDLFDKTLNGFALGGMTLDGDGNPIYLPATKDQASQIITASALQLWTITLQSLQPVLDKGADIDDESLDLALNSLLKYNQQLLRLMNDLTSALERNATEEVFYLRTLQASLLVLALLNFALVCKRLLGQIHQSQNNLQALRNIIDSIETGIVLCDGDQIVRSTNKSANELFGYSDNSLVGKQLKQLVFIDNDRMLGVRRDNSTFVAKINTQTLFEFSEAISLCTITDVSEQERKEKRLMELAFRDQLTGLPNRTLFLERLKRDLLRAKRDSSFLAVMFVDLDGFKAVNDNLGHDAGDELLQLVGKRFQQCCREVDTVARLGGDEFVFVLTSLHSVETAKQVAQNVIKSVNQAFLINGQMVKIGTSIGVAIYPDDHTEAELLIKCADDAMYLAKQNGKNRYALAEDLR